MKLYHFCPLEKNAFGHRLQNPLLTPLLKNPSEAHALV